MRKRKNGTRATPLAKYLEKQGLTQEKFAEILGGIRGWPVDQAHISGWASGKQPPGKATRHFIAIATNNQIPVDSWGGGK